MGSITVGLLSIFGVVLILGNVEAASDRCPLASKTYSCNPKCVQDYDCKHGNVCCPNSCNAKSCVVPSSGNSGSSSNDKYSQSGGAGTYCDNVKCNSYEVCKLDPSTKRKKCMRP